LYSSERICPIYMLFHMKSSNRQFEFLISSVLFVRP